MKHTHWIVICTLAFGCTAGVEEDPDIESLVRALDDPNPSTGDGESPCDEVHEDIKGSVYEFVGIYPGQPSPFTKPPQVQVTCDSLFVHFKDHNDSDWTDDSVPWEPSWFVGDGDCEVNSTDYGEFLYPYKLLTPGYGTNVRCDRSHEQTPPPSGDTTQRALTIDETWFVTPDQLAYRRTERTDDGRKRDRFYMFDVMPDGD